MTKQELWQTRTQEGIRRIKICCNRKIKNKYIKGGNQAAYLHANDSVNEEEHHYKQSYVGQSLKGKGTHE